MPISWTNRRVLVTGGTGFIGSFLVEYLLQKGAKIRVPVRDGNPKFLAPYQNAIEWMEGDLRDGAFCTTLVEGIDEVFHLASHRRNVAHHHAHPSDVANDNIRMTLVLLEGLKAQERTVRVTFFSTGNIPPSLDPTAFAQSEKLDGYILGKSLCETLWLAASKQRGFPLLILRPVGVYGPRDTFTVESNVIPALIVRNQEAEKELSVWGDGAQQRAFLYVEDLIKATMKLHDAEVVGIHYVTPGTMVTVRELAETIRDLVKPGLPIVFDASKTTGTHAPPPLPIHPLLSSMKWTPLAEGLECAYRWWNETRRGS